MQTFTKVGREALLTSAKADDDATVVALAKSGNYYAFEELVSRSEKRIYRVGLALMGSPEDAEDLLQETFLKAFQHLAEFREDSHFHTWLVRIAINEGLMKLRHRRSDRSAPMQDAVNDEGQELPLEFADWRPDPEKIFEQAELRTILQGALQALPPQHRMVFLLRHVEGCSTREAASILKVKEATAKIRLYRVRLRLREELNSIFRQDEGAKKRRHNIRDAPS